MANGHTKQRPLNKVLAKAGYWIHRADSLAGNYRYYWTHTKTGEAGPNPEGYCHAHAETDALRHHKEQLEWAAKQKVAK